MLDYLNAVGFKMLAKARRIGWVLHSYGNLRRARGSLCRCALLDAVKIAFSWTDLTTMVRLIMKNRRECGSM